jgi:hypothetical protein
MEKGRGEYMKHEAIFSLLTLFIALNAFSATNEALPNPTWIDADLSGVDEPLNLSGAEQEFCAQVILEEINKRAQLSLNENDIVKIQLPNWSQPEQGFIRGGGFNIRVVAAIPETRKKLKHLHVGRFADFMTWLKMGDEPSLHLPSNIDGVQTYFETEDEAGTHVDLVAHVDSAYAYLPLGLFEHLFKDVIGADTRNPCPTESGENPDGQ